MITLKLSDPGLHGLYPLQLKLPKDPKDCDSPGWARSTLISDSDPVRIALPAGPFCVRRGSHPVADGTSPEVPPLPSTEWTGWTLFTVGENAAIQPVD